MSPISSDKPASPMGAATIGIVEVAAARALAAGVVQVWITSGCEATSSAASAGNRSGLCES
jgi:hypothetical protein